MSRRILVFGLFLLMTVGMASAADLVMLEPPSAKTIQGPVASLDELDELFFIQRYTSSAEYYLGSGDLGDTMCVVFQPLAACSIYYAQLQWYAGGNYQSFIWDYSDAAEAAYPDGRAVNRGSATASPLGDVLFGPFTNAAEGSQEFEDLFTSEDLPDGGIDIADGGKFVVGFVKTAEGGTPNPLADDVSGRRFTFTWFGGPWTDDAWGAYSSDIAGGTVVDLMMRVAVSYYDGAPPIVGTATMLPNTVNGNKECTVTAEIVDDNGWTTDTAQLMVAINEGDATAYDMTNIDGTNDYTASFTLDNLTVGDLVEYWIVATDDEENVNDLYPERSFFNIVELSRPSAEFLVVDHASSTFSSVGYWAYENDIFYELWDADANKGIDEYTVNNGWDAVIVFGYGSSSIPTRDDDNAFQAYAEDGGNIFFSDQDYYLANGEDAEPTFAAGDFAYDVFGIASGTNDPDPTDSTFYGTADDALSGDFSDTPFYVYPEWTGHWADGVTGVETAVEIFVGEEYSTPGGIRFENSFGGKTVYLGFDVLAAVENVGTDDDPVLRMTDQFATLMNNVFTWFDVTSTPETEVVAPAVYELSQNYPNPFNPSTQITFAVPQAGNVSVKVFNMNGQEVATLFQGQMAPGNKSVTFDASSLASGVYFYRMEAGDFSATRKMMLIK